jgi:glycosyltransferase involved in cell wall biosynthesis
MELNMFVNQEIESKAKEAVAKYIGEGAESFFTKSVEERFDALKNTLVYVRNMTMETEEDAAFRVPAVDFCDKLLLSIANDPIKIEVPEKFHDVYTFSELMPFSNQDLLKEKNLNGYFLAKITGGQHHLAFGSTDIKYPFEKYVSDFDFPRITPEEFNPTTYKEYITANAHKIDVLIITGANNFSLYFASIYKQNRKNGRIVITNDTNRQLIDADFEMDPEFIEPLFSFADVVTLPTHNLRDKMNGDPKNKFPSFTLRHSFANATGEDLSVSAGEKENIILSAGRLDISSKNILMLVSAFSEAADLIPDWKLVLAGEICEENQIYLRKHFANIKNRLIFTGELDKPELYKEYRRAKIFCMPMLADVTPLVCSEAMAFGCYQVLSDSMDGADDLTRNGEYGIVYEQEKYITHPKLWEYQPIEGYNGEVEKNLAAALVTAANKLDYGFMKDFIEKSKNLQRTEFDYDINARILALLLFG